MSSFRAKPAWQKDTSRNHVHSDPIALIYNENQWKLNKVSPLYNLEYSTIKLKQYASKVRQDLVGAVAASAATKYTVLFEEQPDLKYCDEDPSGLMITVSSSQENRAKVSYVAIILSWGVHSTLNGTIHLPYLLERGEQKVGTSVKSTLQNIFDCNIQQFSFTQHHLLKFGFNFIENDSSRSSDPFTLTYKTPQVDHKDKLILTFDVGDMHIIWNGIREEVAKRSELVNLAYQVLQNQIFYMITLDISVFDLCEIALPKADIKSSGIVKMKTPEMVNSVFTVLNEMLDIDKETSNVSDTIESEVE